MPPILPVYNEMQEMNFEVIARISWNIAGRSDVCPPTQMAILNSSMVILENQQPFLNRWYTIFEPLCDESYPRPSRYVNISEGFNGNPEDDYYTWFLKWYFRLDQTWSVESDLVSHKILSNYS
jgi:hypothetical protein